MAQQASSSHRCMVTLCRATVPSSLRAQFHLSRAAASCRFTSRRQCTWQSISATHADLTCVLPAAISAHRLTWYECAQPLIVCESFPDHLQRRCDLHAGIEAPAVAVPLIYNHGDCGARSACRGASVVSIVISFGNQFSCAQPWGSRCLRSSPV